MSYRRSPTCRYCNQRGHTRRTCSVAAATAVTAAAKPVEERSYQDNRALDIQARAVRVATAPRLCSYCHSEGHNRKSCKSLKGDIERYNALNARWWRGVRASLNSPACKAKIGALVTWRTWDGFVFHAFVTGLGKSINKNTHVSQGMDDTNVSRFFLSATLLSSTIPKDERRSWMSNEGDTINVTAIVGDIDLVGGGSLTATLVSEGVGNIEIPDDWGVNVDCSHLFQPAKNKRVNHYFSNGRPDFVAIEEFLNNFKI